MATGEAPQTEFMESATTALGDPVRHREALLALAHEAVATNNPALAFRYADRARRLSPPGPPLIQLCARLLMQQGRHREGLAMLARAGLPLAAGEPAEAASATGPVGQLPPAVLLITHAREGGVGRHIEKRTTALRQEGFRILELKPDKDSLEGSLCRLSAAGVPSRDLAWRLPD